jgi:hypothetical protein
LSSGSHDLCIFNNREEEIAFAISFLGYGLEHNESIILIQDRLEKSLMLSIMKEAWGDLFTKNWKAGNILLFCTVEWYFPKGYQKFDSSSVNVRWSQQVATSLKHGNKGLRCFGETNSFFDYGLKQELVDYETTVGKSLQIPFTAVCAYTRDNIMSFGRDEYERLRESHCHFNSVD